MFDWFYNWLDPKILRLESWVNKKVVDKELLSLDLDKVKPGTTRETYMYSQPPSTKEYGPFIANLEKAELVEYLHGPGVLEAFGLYDLNDERWWRHRNGGTTEDFKYPAFPNMMEFFIYVTGTSKEEYWSAILRTKALEEETDG